MKSLKIPQDFKRLFWSWDFNLLDAQKHKRLIIAQVLNHGNWRAWQWLFKTYGKKELKDAIQNMPASEFRPAAIRLAVLLLGIAEMRYATRTDYIQSKTSH